MDDNTDILEVQRSERGYRVPGTAVEWRKREERVQKVVLRNIAKTRKDLPNVSMDDVHPVKLTQEKFAELVNIFSKHLNIFDDFSRNIQNIQRLILSPDALFWEIPGKALFYLTDIRPENMAFVHIVLYHKDVLRCHELLREMLREVMEKLQLRRLNAFLPASNRKAILLARTIGFRREGLLREWEFRDGHWASMIHFGLMRKDVING